MIRDPYKTVRFAVIIPTYNRAGILEQAVRSVMRQTFTDWELCVVDDASTDDTVEHMRAYCYDERIHLVRLEQNCGESFARNVGIDETQSELVAFLDSDCLWYPTYLEKVNAAFLSQAAPDVVSTFIEAIKWDPAADRTEDDWAPWINLPFRLHHMTKRSIWLGPSQVALKRDLLQRVGYYDNYIDEAEDAELWGRLYMKGARWCFINEVLFTSRRHMQSQTTERQTMTPEQKLARWDQRKAAIAIGGPRTLRFAEIGCRKDDPFVVHSV